MRSLFGIFTILSVMGLAYWAYQENIKTQAAIARTEALQTEIGDARARLAVLRAEWAFLNRPDRLVDLVNLNYQDLHLSPLRADNFGTIDQIEFPSTSVLDLRNLEAVEVAEREATQ